MLMTAICTWAYARRRCGYYRRHLMQYIF